jgi:hypothetical protein
MSIAAIVFCGNSVARCGMPALKGVFDQTPKIV